MAVYTSILGGAGVGLEMQGPGVALAERLCWTQCCLSLTQMLLSVFPLRLPVWPERIRRESGLPWAFRFPRRSRAERMER